MASAVKKMVPAPLRRAVRDGLGRFNAAKTALRERLSRPNIYDLSKPERLGMVYMSKSDMRPEDRIFLYALIRGLKPERVLEIGALQGGSGRIMACAMEDNGKGRIVGLDPFPLFKVDRSFHGRYTLVAKGSPEAVPEARATAGGPFDFVLIDGIHTYDAVRADLDASLKAAADGAYIFFHDGYNYGVNAAVDEALKTDPRLEDCGFLCRTLQAGKPLTGYGGVRLLRLRPKEESGVVAIRAAYTAEGLTAPEYSPEILNHDDWFCQAVRPCERCRRVGAAAKS